MSRFRSPWRRQRAGMRCLLKGADTVIARRQEEAWRFDDESLGIATSCSGDTPAGLVDGFSARGPSPLEANAWGVVGSCTRR